MIALAAMRSFCAHSDRGKATKNTLQEPTLVFFELCALLGGEELNRVCNPVSGLVLANKVGKDSPNETRGGRLVGHPCKRPVYGCQHLWG